MHRPAYAHAPVSLPRFGQAQGVYSSLKLDEASGRRLADYMAQNGIPNPVPPDKMHATILYSQTPVSDYFPLKSETRIPAGACWVKWVENKGKRDLRLCFESPKLEKQVEQGRQKGATLRDEVFHITLSYNVGDWKPSRLAPPDFELVLGPEQLEPLNLKWAEDQGLRFGSFNRIA